MASNTQQEVRIDRKSEQNATKESIPETMKGDTDRELRKINFLMELQVPINMSN